MRLVIAIKAFFAALFDKSKSEQIEQLLGGHLASSSDVQGITQEPGPGAGQPPSRDPAVTLLAALQREARLVDLIQEDLGKYSDAQVGSAARPCLQQCAGVLDRVFGLRPLIDSSEGEMVNVQENASPMRYQWIGEGGVTSGKLVHHGWEATKIELPQWSGDDSDVNVVTPAQVEAP